MKNTLFYLKTHQKLILQIAFGLFFIAMGIYFINQERTELSKVKSALIQADPWWVLWGLFLVAGFVAVQGLMYQLSFKAIHQHIRWWTGVVLYLKRNLISVFLPAGVLTNMLFFVKEIEKKEGVTRPQIYYASTIFSICSILTGIIAGLPAIFWLLLKSQGSGQLYLGILLTVLLLGLFSIAAYSIFQKGKLYFFLKNKWPDYFEIIDELSNQTFSRLHFWQVIAWSFVIEMIGMAHLYIAIKALGGTPSLEIAIIGYAVVLLLLMSSPFLRGIGAIEVVLTYALTLFGFSTVAAISMAFLCRFFEFWSVLALGALALLIQKDNFIIRLLPAFLLFLLGWVNIISAITPAYVNRMAFLVEVLPLDAIHASTWLVLIVGIIMLAVSVYLIYGLRNAWRMAVVLSGISFLAHLTKGIDWEEAIFAGVTLFSLIYQRKQYFIRSNLRLAKQSLFPGVVAVISVILFGTIGFYLLNPQHFNLDFTLWASFKEAVSTFFLVNIDLTPVTLFGKRFLYGMHILGGTTMAYLFFLLLRPIVFKKQITHEEELQKAQALVQKYSKGSLDYFKIYSDKQFWFSPDGEGFVSFKTTRNYAIVLENPVCANEEALRKIIPAFDEFCRKNGLRTAYYRIPVSDKKLYESLGKKVLPIGEEAVVNLETFSLQGRDKAGMRNAINKLTKLGFQFKIHQAPQSAAFLQQLRAVSDNWLKDMNRSEIIFSQGLFEETELKFQTIMTMEDAEGKIDGFINQIPNFTPTEANFDLMRKTAEAPNGTMDFLFTKMFDYFKQQGFKKCSLGMVPMSGIDRPENFRETIIKTAYERMRQFEHYKHLYDFKEKFDPDWTMMYLAYSAHLDLIYLPIALEKIIQA